MGSHRITQMISPEVELHTAASRRERVVTALKRSALGMVGFWTIFYFVLVFSLAHQKPFWNDELFTFYISRLRNLSDVWNALLTGAEQLPPFFFVITRAASAIFGFGHVFFRLPETLGYWLMCVSLFYLVRVRCSVMYGLIAMAFPLVTASFEYAYEARPYGLVLGLCALALSSWQAASRYRLRVLSLVLLTLSGAAAMSCHYYALLGLLPIVVGECVRCIYRKKIDFGPWIAFALWIVPLAFFLPLIKAAHSYSEAFWSKPKWTNTLGFYNTLLTPTALTFAVILIGLGIYHLARSSQNGDRIRVPGNIPVYEVAAVSAFALVPVLGIFLAKTVTGAFNFRYGLPAVIGLSILVAWSSSVLSDQRADIGVALFLMLSALSLANGMRLYLEVGDTLNTRVSAYQFLRMEAAGKPIVIVDPHLFFELSHDVTQRGSNMQLIYFADTTLALKYTNTDTVERGLLALKRLAPLDVRSFGQFNATHDHFLVYGYPGPFEWLVEDLIASGWELVVEGRNGKQLLFLAKRPHDR